MSSVDNSCELQQLAKKDPVSIGSSDQYQLLEPKNKSEEVSRREDENESNSANGLQSHPEKRESSEVKEKMKKKEIVIPKDLYKILFDDVDRISRQFQICCLPVEETVAKIIGDYIQEVRNQGKEQISIEYDDGQIVEYTATELIQNAKGTKDYFDLFLPIQLLYNHEKLRYEQLKEELMAKALKASTSTKGRSRKANAPEHTPAKFKFSAAEYYGLPHLLRLLNRFEYYLANNGLHPAAVKSATKTTCDLLIYLNMRSETLIKGINYENATKKQQRALA